MVAAVVRASTVAAQQAGLLSASQAAQLAGVSRWAIHRAIKSRALNAIRDNRNEWRISPDDVAAWRGATVATQLRATEIAQTDVAGATAAEVSELRAKLAAAQLGEAVASARAAAAEAERDKWHGMAMALASRRRWWPFG